MYLKINFFFYFLKTLKYSKEDELNNLIAESSSNNIEETATQSPMVTQCPDVDAQRKILFH